ncbi:MAG: 5' nucleotidase, NT5C type [Cetobacterium sp.]
MKSQLHVLVDMDDTIANWSDKYFQTLNEMYPHLKFRSREETVNWDLTHDMNPEQVAAIQTVMDLPSFYADLEPIPGAIEALHEMEAEGILVSICSSPWLTNPTCLQDKVDWLERHVGEGWGARIVLTKDKTLVTGDFLIDDKPVITGADSAPQWTHITFTQPHNKSVDTQFRMGTWNEWRGLVYGTRAPRVWGVGGLLRAGKDTVADCLVEEYGWVKMGMSEPLADALYALNPIIEVPGMMIVSKTEKQLTYQKRYQELVDEVGYTEAKTNPEVRRLLQVLGTEVGREMIDENVWADIAYRNIESHLKAGRSVVLTGVRFQNELDMIHKFGNTGHSIFVTRPDVEAEAGALGGHTSETSLSAEDFQTVLDNSATIEDLQKKVNELLDK